MREYEVRGNRALANGRVGIHLGPRTDDVQVTGNLALGNGAGRRDGLDCQDESKGENAGDGTAGTENTWQDNVGVRAAPPGICAAPTQVDEPAGHGKDHGKRWDDGRRWGHDRWHHRKHDKQHQGYVKHRPDLCTCTGLPWRF